MTKGKHNSLVHSSVPLLTYINILSFKYFTGKPLEYLWRHVCCLKWLVVVENRKRLVLGKEISLISGRFLKMD